MKMEGNIKEEICYYSEEEVDDNMCSDELVKEDPLCVETNDINSYPDSCNLSIGFEQVFVKHEEVKTLHPQEISSVTVRELQQLKFSQLSLHEKVIVKKRGRSTPDLLISQPGISNKKKYIRSFNSEWYQQKSWLCGCEVKNALFCFPCLLFGGDVTWTKDGFRNINKMKEKTEKHEKSKKHVDNVLSLSLLETVSIKEKLSEAYRLSISEHNVKVKKNREILSKVIDCIFYCGNFETPLHVHDEKDDSVNPWVFRGLVNFASKLDSDLKNHLEASEVFKGVSETIQNEILDCLLQIYHEEIRTEIRKASFVAIMADDTTDVSEHTQMVLVLRYVLNGEIFERFWGFFIPENQTADGISKCVLEQLDIILQGNEQKLIAQTFDGANVMKGKKAGVQAKIKAVYSNAHFIHCYAHQLNLIMRNAASIARNARIFFSNILAIPTFFSRSPQRVAILKKHMNLSIPHPSSTSWDFDIQTINRVHENLQPLKNCLTEIQSTSNADQTIAEATGILKYLNDDNFKFWLELFHQIMPHVEIIYNQMQSQKISVFKVNEYITNFQTAILELRNSKYCENPSKVLMAEAKEVCDWLCVDIMDRYSSTKHLAAAKLFNKKWFTSFKNKHPTEEIVLTAESYPMIDKEKLETELKVFYCRSDIHEYCTLFELLKFILENNLGDVLGEITKLINILLTVPMTTSETERCFSTLKRIRTFLKSNMNSERLNALSVLSMEKNFLSCHLEIKEKIIDLFAQIKTRRMDFIYK
ncbi:zinc finger MYM-type protein 1-like isoform X2 [Lycorma delicatula]|uniref:zinc finger MYM-type protein 1-like isoform X2 n=1 Tax=Lycorma delicatula TaxID=130591 RepID=UPI003F51A918